jgi:hypothetical protein
MRKIRKLENQSMNPNDHIRNIIASSCATGIAEIATIPICAIKTNYQTKPLEKLPSVKDVVKGIYTNKGIKGFYSASLPAMSSQIISTSGKYTLYRFGTANNVPTVIAAIGSGIVVSLFTHPLDFIRVAVQRGDKIFKGNSHFSQLSLIEKSKNYQKHTLEVKMFYRGYSKSLTKVIVGSSLYFPIYDFTKKNINKRLLVDNSLTSLLSSMTSAIISTIILQPIDYIKVRNIAGLPWYQGLNPLKYLRGSSLNLLRVVPHFMITMTLTEKFHTLLQ